MSNPGWAGLLDALCSHFSRVATTSEAALGTSRALRAVSGSPPVVRPEDRALLAR